MAVLYKSFQSVLEDKNHKKMFHPRVIYTANISTSQIAKEIAAYSSLSPGDVKNTLDNLVTVMGQHLQASESVSWRLRKKCRLRKLLLRSVSFPTSPRTPIGLPLPALW